MWFYLTTTVMSPECLLLSLRVGLMGLLQPDPPCRLRAEGLSSVHSRQAMSECADLPPRPCGSRNGCGWSCGASWPIFAEPSWAIGEGRQPPRVLIRLRWRCSQAAPVWDSLGSGWVGDRQGRRGDLSVCYLRIPMRVEWKFPLTFRLNKCLFSLNVRLAPSWSLVVVWEQPPPSCSREGLM